VNDPSPVRNVSDTALWVAIYRAIESERRDAIFNDPFARRLGGARGEAIVRSMPSSEYSAWPIIVRTAVMDHIVKRCVRAGAKTVLNLAAGLDARAFRLDLPPDLRWIHADLPPMVDYFRERMAGETPRCALEYAALDLREEGPRRALLESAAATGPVLAITEGLLLYLPEASVVPLARELHDLARARWWLTDLASPKLLKMLEERWAPAGQQDNAPFVFGPAGGRAWYEPHGWRELEWHSTFAESLRIKRTMRGGAVFWKLMDKLQSHARRHQSRRMSGILLMGNDNELELARKSADRAALGVARSAER
jgi:methyltransferase (TIGR00027 family)